jgi:hypothetical protein
MAINTAGQTLTATPSQQQGQFAVGKIVFDGTAITAADYIQVNCGFKPKYVKFVNVTDRIAVEFFDGMADDTCVKTAAAGTVTLETTNKGITPNQSGFLVSQNGSLLVIVASKTMQWMAYA